MKRSRSPSLDLPPPIVVDYQPYTSRVLERRLFHQGTRPARDQWDCYYRNNTTKGYKDRHYILREFVELGEVIEACAARGPLQSGRVSSDTSSSSRSLPFPFPSKMDSSPLATMTTSMSHAPGKPNREYPQGQYDFCWLELGCGVGNAFLPIFEAFGHLPQWSAMFGADISRVAIDLLRSRVTQTLPLSLQAKVHTCVLDPTQSDLSSNPTLAWETSANEPVAARPAGDDSGCVLLSSSSLPPPSSRTLPYGGATHTAVFASMIFVLSSIEVRHHRVVLNRVAQWMRLQSQRRRRHPPHAHSEVMMKSGMEGPPEGDPYQTVGGATFFFRDYAAEDHAQHRFCRRRRCGGAEKWTEESVGATYALEERESHQRQQDHGKTYAAVAFSGAGPTTVRSSECSHPQRSQEEGEEKRGQERVGAAGWDGAEMTGCDFNGGGGSGSGGPHGERNTFVRSNGTLTHFFRVEEVRQLFTGVGFAVIDLRVLERDVCNRGEGIHLCRRFIQGRFSMNIEG